MCNKHQQETKKTMPWVGYLVLAKNKMLKKGGQKAHNHLKRTM